MDQELWLNCKQSCSAESKSQPFAAAYRHHDSVQGMLRALGADAYDLLLPETRALPLVIQPKEKILGIVYGRYKRVQFEDVTGGRGILIATNKRIILFDKKPLFYKSDDIPYRAVSGVTETNAGPAATVSVHTKIGDINIRSFNKKCARNFVQTVEHVLDEEVEA